MSRVDDGQPGAEPRPAVPEAWSRRLVLPVEDDAAAARHEKIERIRRGLVWLSAVITLGLMAGLMLGRVLNGPPPPLFAPAAPQLLAVAAQDDGQQLLLQLRLDRAVAYRRSEANGAVRIFLPGVQLPGGSQRGRVATQGRSLSWRVTAQADGVQALLVGLAGPLRVRDRLESAGEHWVLRLNVPLQGPVAQGAVATE